MSNPATVPWVQYNELVIAQGHPTLPDVTNRPLEFIISQSDMDSTAPFPGFLGRYLNAGSPETVIAANPGVACFDTTNGNLYVKKTGTTNTGWQLVGGTSTVAAGTIGQLSKFLSATQVGNSLVSETTGITVAVGASAFVANFAAGSLTKAAAGTHPIFAGAQFNPPTINAGAATVTDAATVYISGAPTGTFTHLGKALWVGGVTHIEGQIIHGPVPGFNITGVNALFCDINITAVDASNNSFGWDVEPVFTVSASGPGSAVLYSQLHTAASAITIANGIGMMIDGANKGAGSTITTLYGLKINDQTAGATNFAIFTGLGKVQFGDALTVTGSFRLQGAGSPILWFLIDTNESLDNKKWRVYSNTGVKQIKWQVVNDAEAVATDFLRITRNTTTPTLIEFPTLGHTCPIRVGGAVFGALGLKADWNTVDGIGFENGGAGTYDTWRMGPGAGNGFNEFNWYNGTAASLMMRLTNAGVLIVTGTDPGAGGNLRVNGSIGSGGSIALQNGVAVNVGDLSNSCVFVVRDSTNGGTALVVVDNTGASISILGQVGTTVFVTAAPAATQVQVSYSAGQFKATGGSSRGGATLRWSQYRTQ